MGSEQSSNAGQGHQGNTQHEGESPTIGVGHRTSGEAGATRTHETMGETGGSGGDGLTGNQVGGSRQLADEHARARQAADNGARGDSFSPGTDPGQAHRPAPGSAIDSGARGFQDTRSEQAGGSETGLGTPETGANQNAADMERSGRERRK